MQGNLAVAVKEFDQALQSPGLTDSANQGLKRLIDTLKSDKPLLPEDVAFSMSPGDLPGGPKSSDASLNKPAGVLEAAMVYDLTGRTGEAETMLAKILPEKLADKDHRQAKRLPGVLPSQKAFAAYLRGKLLAGQKRYAEAQTLLLASLKGYRKGTWHDATLYLIADSIERQAQADFDQKLQEVTIKAQKDAAKKLKKQQAVEAAKKAEQDKLAGKLPEKAKADNIISNSSTETEFNEWDLPPDLRAEYRQTLRTAEDNGRKVYKKSCATALPYWQQLTKYFPKSPYAEVALYNQAVLLYEDEKFEDASKVLDQLVKAYPTSPFAGDACVKLTDIALERMFDIKLAQSTSEQAGNWAKNLGTLRKNNIRKLELWKITPPCLDSSQLTRIRYECFLRAGLLAYLSGRYEQAVNWISFAGPKPPAEGFTVDSDLNSIGLYYLLKAIRSKKPVTDQRALDIARNELQRSVLQLGDLYLETIRPDKAEAIFMRIIENDFQLGTVPPSIKGYAMLQVAIALDRQSNKRAEALEWLKKVTINRDLQGTYWGGCGLFRLALFTYNQTQDPKKSIPLYKRMLKKYPDHELTELAHLYLCLDAIQLKDNALVIKASHSFFKKYPKTKYRHLLKDKLKTIEQQPMKTNAKKGK